MLADEEADHAEQDLRSQVLAAFDGEAHVSALALSDQLGLALNKVCDTIDALAKEAGHAEHDLRSQVLAAFDGEAHVSALALSDQLGLALNKVCDTIDALAKEGLIYRVFCWTLSPGGEAELEVTVQARRT